MRRCSWCPPTTATRPSRRTTTVMRAGQGRDPRPARSTRCKTLSAGGEPPTLLSRSVLPRPMRRVVARTSPDARAAARDESGVDEWVCGPRRRMPKLTRRSRILIAVALAVVLLLLIGPRLIDAYVDWLWFGELGYRSVFTTVLVTRLVVFLVAAAADRRRSSSPALALAYRTRPVFVPTAGPNDPVARYRTAVMARLRLFGIGVPVVIGLLAGIVAQSYWVRVQLFLHGGDFGITDPQFGMDLGFYAFDLPFYRLVLTYPVRRDVPGVHREPVGPLPVRRHPAVRAHRCAEPSGAHPAGQPGRHAGAAQGGRLLARPLRTAQPHPRRQAVHRRRLHRHQRGAARQADPAGDRA